jgi:hypothetical protein
MLITTPYQPHRLACGVCFLPFDRPTQTLMFAFFAAGSGQSLRAKTVGYDFDAVSQTTSPSSKRILYARTLFAILRLRLHDECPYHHAFTWPTVASPNKLCLSLRKPTWTFSRTGTKQQHYCIFFFSLVAALHDPLPTTGTARLSPGG